MVRGHDVTDWILGSTQINITNLPKELLHCRPEVEGGIPRDLKGFPMMIYKITLFCRLQLVVETELNDPTNQNSRKVPKVVKPTNKKTLL